MGGGRRAGKSFVVDLAWRVQKLEWTLAQPFISTWQPPKASQPKSHVQVVEVSDTELLNKKDKEIDILKELLAKQEMAPADSTMQSQLVTKDGHVYR